jgi:hypothetical protein
MAGGDLTGGKTSRAATGAFICFEDEAGVTGRPPKGRTWGRRGITPTAKVAGPAGAACRRPGCFASNRARLPVCATGCAGTQAARASVALSARATTSACWTAPTIG